MTEEKTKRSRSLAFVLASGFLALSLTALIIAYIPQGILFLQTELSRIKAEQNGIANGAANQVANFVQEKFSSLELSANLVEPGANSQEEQVRVLSHLLAEHPSLRSVILLDENGREIAQSTRLAQAELDSLVQQVEAAQPAVLGGEVRYVSPVYINEVTSEPLITIAVPVQNILGDLKGILLAEVNLKFMWDLVGGIQVGETGSAFVVDNNGDLLAHRDISRVLAGENLSQMVLVDQFVNGGVPPGENVFSNNENLNGTQGIVTLVNMGIPNWAVMTFLPTTEGIQGLLINFAISFGIVLVLAGLIVWVGVLLARRLSGPLIDLTNTATEISEGNINLRATVEGPTEVISLAEAFNVMTNQLQGILESMEQRVADRTRALEISNEVSRRLSTILDQRELVREVVEQVRGSFDYYHAHIYLFDDSKENLLMAGGTGRAGEIMLERGHSVPKGRGLVGRAADTNLPIWLDSVERTIGYEAITSETVDDVFERESSFEVTKTWYANQISASFTDIQDFAERIAQKKASGEQTPKLGYIIYGLNDFLETVKTGAEEAAQYLGIEVEIVSADFDNERGIQQFREMIAAGKDGLIVTPLIAEKWITPIQEAVDKGIPVLTANLRCPGSVASAWIGQNSYQSGLILARQILETLPAAGKMDGEIVVGSARDIQELQERYAGLKQGLQDSAYTLSEFYDVPLDDEQENLAGWEHLVETHPDMVAAVGLASVDLPNLIRIKRRLNAPWETAGYDVTIEVLDAIKDGTAQVTIGQHPYLQGYLPVLALSEHFVDGIPLKGWIVESWQSNPLLPDTRTEAAVPISIAENVLGVLDVQDDEIGRFEETDIELLQSIANQVAIGLQNAQAYQQTQQQVATEALISNINQQIQSTSNIDDALQVAVREVGRALGTETSISLNKLKTGNGQEE